MSRQGLSFCRPFRLRNDERGAAAIEYAIIGALIGIGLIGSLVGTKGSLNAIFGRAATQMASGGALQGLQFNSANPRAAFWSAKTVKSGPTHYDYGTRQLWQTVFTDGSVVDYESYSSGQTSVTTFDPVSLTSSVIYMDPSGSVPGGRVYTWSNASRTNMTYETYSSDFTGSNPNTMVAGPCASNSCSMSPTSVTASFRQSMTNAYSDIALWSANTP